jgi:hypothetical protein
LLAHGEQLVDEDIFSQAARAARHGHTRGVHGAGRGTVQS